jgi:hypothetical protein
LTAIKSIANQDDFDMEVNGDGITSLLEALYVLQKITGLR